MDDKKKKLLAEIKALLSDYAAEVCESKGLDYATAKEEMRGTMTILTAIVDSIGVIENDILDKVE